MKCKWDGDYYDVLRDCFKVIFLNLCYLKVYFCLVCCFFEFKYVVEVLECLDDFKGKFLEQVYSSVCDVLGCDIIVVFFFKNDGEEKKGFGGGVLVCFCSISCKDFILEDEMVLWE